ncbi:MAG TPA: hypothetical protein VEL07_04290 [Planctomycetota bacterium]|nr:hypothetical protein [Planctomycetota bacterium]
MTIDLMREKGVPLDKQSFDWAEIAGPPTSKLDSDAFTRVRIILMNGIEAEANRFSHAAARFNPDLRLPLAKVRRAEQHQQTLVNWLLPGDLTAIETTLAFEQVAIELTAHIALTEPDAYIAQGDRFGLLEDFDHLYRFAALADRVYGIDANAITQCYTDIMPGRPTVVEHRAPVDDVRKAYDRRSASPLTKLNVMTLVASENQTHDYYMTIGPTFSNPLARQLYAEIASIEEQHVTHYESLADGTETWLEKWVLHEATEVWNYWSCAQSETDPRVRAIWERFVAYELGHLHVARSLFEQIERRDVAEILPKRLPDAIGFESHRGFLRQLVADEVDLRARGTGFVPKRAEGEESKRYRARINASGSPSEAVARDWSWRPGAEPAIAGATRSPRRKS